MNELDYIESNYLEIVNEDIEDDKLRKQIINNLLAQGFIFEENNNSIKLVEHSKEVYRYIQQKSRLEKIKKHKNFIKNHWDFIKNYTINGYELNPRNISLELRIVRSGSFEEKIFRWWNFTWWSIPYQRPYGRQMRWIIWDRNHNTPFGLIGLHSPGLQLSARDQYLGIDKNEKDWWINQSMSAQRVGALPPYNKLLGGKMVALALVAKEIRKEYHEKYKGKKTIIEGRVIPASLLFITTTGAFGKSSIYNRLKMNNIKIAKLIGYTKGSGTFHISDDLYAKIIKFLKKRNINTEKHFGNGPSRKRQLISKAFELLGLPDYQYHGLKRSVYLFEHCKNLKNVINKKEEPQWYEMDFETLFDFWIQRWGLPRAESNNEWRLFDVKEYFNNLDKLLEGL